MAVIDEENKDKLGGAQDKSYYKVNTDRLCYSRCLGVKYRL